MTDRTTYDVQRDIEDSCEQIRRVWEQMWPPLSAATVRRASASAGILAEGDDDDPRDGDMSMTDRILSTRYETLQCLQFWARVVLDRFDVRTVAMHAMDVDGMCRFLATWAAHMSGQEDGEDCARAIKWWAEKCDRIANPPVRNWLPIGDCPNTIGAGGEAVVCGTQVRVYPDHPGDIKCHGCGKTETFDGWVLLMCGTEGLLTTEQLVGKLHHAGYAATTGLVRQWKRRGIIAPSAHDETGRSMWDRVAVLAALGRRAG